MPILKDGRLKISNACRACLSRTVFDTLFTKSFRPPNLFTANFCSLNRIRWHSCSYMICFSSVETDLSLVIISADNTRTSFMFPGSESNVRTFKRLKCFEQSRQENLKVQSDRWYAERSLAEMIKRCVERPYKAGQIKSENDRSQTFAEQCPMTERERAGESVQKAVWTGTVATL